MINIIGIGPERKHMTLASLDALKEVDVVVGYKKYIDSIQDLIEGKEIIKKGMGDEIKRVEIAIKLSNEGKNVAIVSSGDPGVFGMANVFFQILGKYSDVEVNVIPGVSAVNYASSILGAPLHDFAVISLSDILTPLCEIENKIRNAVKAGFIIAFYNPISKTRKEPFRLAKKILEEEMSQNTTIGIVRSDKKGEKPPKVTVTNLSNLNEDEIDMSTIIIVGNAFTYSQEESKGVAGENKSLNPSINTNTNDNGNKSNNYMVTPRGYVVREELHPLAIEFYESFLKNETVTGENKSCEYYPCHKEGQSCDFCYCPFYPCGDGSTGGHWIKDKNVWSCQNCTWIHESATVECIQSKLLDYINEVDDLKTNKKKLLKLRRECILKTSKR
ncbi:MAG: precorrin-3B C(17)-methyltransferase [Methanobacteriaceae archaeon]